MQISAEQYRKLSALGPEPTEDQIILALLGKSKSKMTLKEIRHLDLSKWQMPEPTLFPNVVTHEGILYGKQDMQTMTFGLYIDLLEQAKDLQTNLIYLMCMLWRPITHVTMWQRVKAWFAMKGMLTKSSTLRRWGMKVLAGITYSIEDYDPVACMKRETTFQTLPGTFAAYTTTFFLITSEQLVQGSLRSLRDLVKAEHKALQESLKRISEAGDGFPTSGPSQGNGR